MSRILRFCAFLFVLFFTGNVLAAGYTCPTTSYKKYTSCNAGYYMTLNGTYNGTPTVGNACTKCTTGYYCAGGTANRKIACSAGYYLPANSTTCTTCPAGSYCPGGNFDVATSTSDRGINSCPAASGSNIDSLSNMMVWIKDACPTATSENTTFTSGLTTWGTGAKSINECKVNYVVTTPCGSLRKESVPFNSTYDTYTGNSNATYNSSYEMGDRYFRTLTAGYYLMEPYSTTYCSSDTKKMFYKKAVECPGGGVYCPGFTADNYPTCADSAWEYGEPIGMYGCGTGAASTGDGDGDDYWLTATGADARTDCYVRVILYKNGGTGSITGDSTATGTTSGTKTCYYNTACSLPDASGLTQTGYKFSGGWGTTSSATSCSNSITLTSAKVALTNYYACKNPTYSITLNKNNGGMSSGTSTLYTTKTVGVYLNSARTQSLTTAGTYKVTMPTWAPEYYHSESEYPVTFDARPAFGYYSSSDGGTQYVDADGVITSSGLTAAKGYGANATWHAQYDTMVTAPDAPANKAGYTFAGWCLDNSENCAGGQTVAAGGEFDLNDLDGELTAMWAPYTTIRITYNGQNDISGVSYVYATEGIEGVYLDAAHTKKMTATANPITYPTSPITWDVNFTDADTDTDILVSAPDADPEGVYDSAGTQMIDSRGYITTDGIAAAKAVTYTAQGYDATWDTRWVLRPGACLTVPDAPTRAGYTFDGWATDQGDVFQPGDEYCSHEYSDQSLEATWTANKYTITLDNANATTDGTDKAYFKYMDTMYLDSDATKAMTNTTNPITVPKREYTVAYNVNGGTLSSTSEKVAYSFAGYYNNSAATAGESANRIIMPTGYIAGDQAGYIAATNSQDITLYAKWTSGSVTLPMPTRAGYTFGGWYSNSSLTNRVGDAGASYMPTANVTLYAKWTANTYTVKFNSNKPSTATSTMSGTMSNQSFTYDVAQKLTANTFSLPGYTFTGWATSSTGSVAHADEKSVSNLTATSGGTVELFAKWTPNTITLSWANGVRGTAPTSPASCTYDGTFTTPAAMTDTGYTQTHWYMPSNNFKKIGTNTSVACTYESIGVYSGTAYFTGSWEANTYTIAYDAAGGYLTEYQPTSGMYDAPVTISAPERNGYTFIGWKITGMDGVTHTYGDATTTETSISSTKASSFKNLRSTSGTVTFTAQWQINTYTIKYMDGSTEITGLTPTTYNVTTATFNLPTAYKATYKFASWHTDSALTSSVVTRIANGTTGNKVYYVKWSTCPAGSVCDGDDVVTCPAGSYCLEGSSEATPCAKGSYSTGGATTCTLADAGYYVDTEGAVEQTACNTVAGKLYIKSAEGSDAATDCYVTLESKVYLAKPTDTATTTCTAGYYCAGGDYYYSSTATDQGRSSCTDATYSGAGAAACTDCPSGYTANTSPNKTANTQCQISVDGGHYIAEAGQNSTNWGTCEAGYAKAAHTVNYGSTSSCAACTGATYAEEESMSECKACPTATKYADKVKGYTYWIDDNIHDTEDGCRAVMKTTELLHGDLSSTSMECNIKNGDYGDSYCQVTASDLTCDGGYYLNSTSSLPNWIGYDNAVANACTSVGTGYWSAEGDRTRTACATGLTTCGSGLCANEADDCGRKLHAGDKVIHLRSAKRTTPALHVMYGDQKLYGNLVAPRSGTLKVANGGITYSVVSDEQ